MLLESLVAPLATFLAPASPLAPPPVQFHGAGVVHTTVYVGGRDMKAEFEPADQPFTFGIALDIHEPGRSTSFEAGYFYSSDDASTRFGANSVDISTTVHELWAGGRWAFDPWDGPLRPYVGLGGSLLRAKFETSGGGGSDSNSGTAIGIYAHGGLEFEFGGGWSAGIDLRGLYSTEAKLQQSTPLDYVQAALTLSYAW